MDEHGNNTLEVGVLQRKLQSKAEALLILSQELDQCRSERDQLKLIADQAQNRSLLKKTVSEQMARGRMTSYNDHSTFHGSTSSHYLEMRELNKLLQYEIQDLKQKLREAYGDIKVLRAGVAEGSRTSSVKDISPAHQREELVEQLEQMGGRVTQLEADLRGLLDEKEELITERETYQGKVARLNHQLNILLRGDVSSRLVDIDALVMDHKYLQEQLQQLQAEKELAHQALHKYKSMLERRRNKGAVRLGTGTGTQTPAMVVSHKQVQELLEKGSPSQLPNTEATLADLRSLCVALLEALQDKSLALTHQRRANKILASRVCELEQRLGTTMPSSLLQRSDQEWMTSVTENFLEETEESNQAPNSKSENDPEPMTEVGLCEHDNDDSLLPEDIQELVSKALQEIQNEDSKTN